MDALTIISIIEVVILPLNALLVLIAVVAVYRRIKHQEFGNDLNYLFIFFVIALILDTVQYFFPKGQNNLFINHIATPVEFFFFTMTFRNWETKLKKWYTLTIPFLTALIIIDCYLLVPQDQFPLRSMIIGAFLVLVFSGRTIFVISEDQKYRIIIVFSIMFYSVMSMFLSVFLPTDILAAQVKVYVTEVSYLAFIAGVISARNRSSK